MDLRAQQPTAPERAKEKRPMPDKPDTWAKLMEALSNPLWQGAIMAILIACLRIIYEAKESSKKRIVVEALLCGALSFPASLVIEWLEWPSSLMVVVGSTIGFIGVVTVREIIMKFIGRKVDAI